MEGLVLAGEVKVEIFAGIFSRGTVEENQSSLTARMQWIVGSTKSADITCNTKI